MEFKTAEEKLLHDYGALEDENEALKDAVDDAIGRINDALGQIPPWFREFYEAGRRGVFMEYGNCFFPHEVDATDDGGHIGFDEWYSVGFHRFPDYMSKNDFKSEFEAELRDIYGKKLAEASEEGSECQ